jgi:SAM-dependent methyltransferase
MTQDRAAHWNTVYSTKADNQVSWFEPRPDISLELIQEAGLGTSARVIDIGGGTSRLIDHLLDAGFRNLTLLDVSDEALQRVRTRLGPRAAQVRFVRADAAQWEPDATFDLWHDRAALHFLTDEAERAHYGAAVRQAMAPGGVVVLGSFALAGPERCSGLPVQRYDAAAMQQLLGPDFHLETSFESDHMTPSRAMQRFQFARFRRRSQKTVPLKAG